MTEEARARQARPAVARPTPPGCPDRRLLAIVCALSAVVLLTAIWWLTPWQPLGPQAPAVRPDVQAAFSGAEIARSRSFREALGPWGVLTTVLLVATPWLLWWALGGRGKAGRGPDPGRRRRRWPVVVGTVAAVHGLLWLLGLPQALHAETVLRRYGLSTQQWPGWLRDEALSWVMSLAVTAAAVLLLWWAVRRLPRVWPYAVAAAAAGVVVLGSFLWPAVVEPAFNDFRPLAAGPLHEDIEELALRAGLGPTQILVSDASVRTSAHNAYVSGLGTSRRVVLYDTVVAAAHESPQEREAVLAIVAHELAHVTGRDVARGTTIGALGAFTGVLVLALLATSGRARRPILPARRASRRSPRARRSGSDAVPGTVRAVVLLLAVATTAQWVATPVSTLVSRRIEAAADIGALELTRDPEAFQRMQHDLAVTNLARLEDDPAWWRTAFFASHPHPPWRIAQAQVWARLQEPEPGR